MMNEQCGGSTSGVVANRCHFSCLSWTAIFAGAFIGVGLGFLLYLFELAIGLTVTHIHEGAVTLAIGGFVGLLIGTIVSMFLAGFTAGHLGRPYSIKRGHGVLYGFVAWSVALILAAGLSAPMNRYISAYSAYIGNAMVNTAYYHHEGQVTAGVTRTSLPEAVAGTSAEPQAKTISLGAFLLFIIFFIGAISSCFGGHFGMTCDNECNRSNPRI